jgi:hypothetical protein
MTHLDGFADYLVVDVLDDPDRVAERVGAFLRS